MEAIKGWNDVSADAPESRSIKEGVYLMTVVGAYVKESKNTGNQYIDIDLEFTDGEMTGFCKEVYEKFSFWPCTLSLSLKDTVLWKLKRFERAYTDENHCEWTWDENEWAGKDVYVLLNTEEYEKNNGNVGTRVARWGCDFLTHADVKSGKHKAPKCEKLPVQKFESIDSLEAALSDNPFK